MGNMKNRIIKLDEKNVFKSKLENANEFDTSFFNECYFNAYKGVKDIIKNEKDIRPENKDRTLIQHNDDYNNIIAFLGDRGSGKTSTMKSFAESLKDKGIKFKEEEDIFSKSYFEVLDTIDPSLFTNKESLVEIVVAEMFKCFKNSSKTCGLNKKQELVKLFEEVFQEIRTLNMNKEAIFKESNDNIETLIDLSSALSLRKDLRKLIEVYIEYMKKDCEEDKKAQFLVIPIDDLDMNLTVGEKLLEDIRRYLIQKNVIILLAVKFEQLQEIVTQKFVVGLNDNFKFNAEVYRNSSININPNTHQYNPLVDFKSDIDEKVEKYLDKLLPYNRRCYMPALDSSQIEVILDGNFFNNIRIDSDRNYYNLWELVKINLYKKLGYIMMSENHYRAIVPKNLRALIELLILLNSMKNENKKENLYNIRKYYNQVVINQVSDREDTLFLRDLLYCYFNDVNKRSLLFLNKKILGMIGDGIFNFNKLGEDLNYINKNKTLINSERVTLGDIVTWIKIYETIESSNKERKFIEIFKSIYTLRLLHGYKRDIRSFRNNIGVNYIGKYFQVTNNQKQNEFSLEGYVPGKSDFSERFKKISVVEKNKIIKRIDEKEKNKTIEIYNKQKKGKKIKITSLKKIKFKKLKYKNIREITDEDLLERIPLIMQPSFGSEYSRLIRREKSNYREVSDFEKIEYFNIYPVNIIGYNLIKDEEAKKEIEFIINIDCFLTILNLLDKQIYTKGDSIIKIIGMFNKVSIDLNKMELCYDKSNEGYEEIEFIDEKNIKIIKYYIENYIPVLTRKDEQIKKIEESKETIEIRLKYMQDKKEYRANALRDTIDKLVKILDDKKEKTQYSKQLEVLVSYKNIFKSGKKVEKEDNDVKYFEKELIKMRDILEGVLRELKE